MADEARLNNHFHGCVECAKKNGTPMPEGLDLSLLWQRLMRHHKLVTVEYPRETEKDCEFPMPVGLEKRDIYMIDQV